MTNTLDADYETVAASGERRPTRTVGRGRLGLLAVVVAFGGLLGVSALRTEQTAPQRAAERAELVDRIHDGQRRLDTLHAGIASLQGDITSLQQALADEVNSNRALADRLSELGMAAGSAAVTAPGVEIVVDDAAPTEGPGGVILDTDLQALINGLWQAGAEAIAIDGYRLTSLTSIRFAGEAITVDYRSLSPPYKVDAIGDPEAMPSAFLDTDGGQTWLGLRADFGISFEMTPKDRLVLAGDPHDHLLYAQPPKGAS